MSEPKTVCAGTVDVVPNIFIPAVDSQLTIDLPGERTRATVKRVVDQDRVIVELTTMPMSKSHQYRFKDTVAVRRTVPADMRAPGSVETWAVVEERRTLPHDIPAPTPAPDSSRPPVAHGFRKILGKAPNAAHAQETKHASVAGLEPRGDRAKHPRNGRRRASAKSGGGGKSQQRQKTSKLPGRPGGSRKR